MLTNRKIEANFSKLKEQFLSYSKEIQTQLIESELQYDVMLSYIKSYSKNHHIRKIHSDWHTYRRHGLKTPTGDLDDRVQAHIRHNVYRTLFALSLDCDIEQKVKILAKTCKIEGANKYEIYNLCLDRLESAENIIAHTITC